MKIKKSATRKHKKVSSKKLDESKQQQSKGVANLAKKDTGQPKMQIQK